MAVTIPSDKGKPGLPQFQLTGEKVVTENPATTTTLTNETIDAWLVKDGSDFVAQKTITMNGAVDIAIIDAAGGGNTVSKYKDGDFQGRVPAVDGKFGPRWEVYYTLNGKNPTRTKAYLYTGPFTLSDNKSGSDNTIIKARAYKNGIWSDVAKIELIISDVTSTNTDPSV